MEIFSIEDLQIRAAELIQKAEAGHLSMVVDEGKPVFVAIPFGETLLKHGVRVAMAISLFCEHKITLVQAARLAEISVSEMIDKLAERKISICCYSAEELVDEVLALSDT